MLEKTRPPEATLPAGGNGHAAVPPAFGDGGGSGWGAEPSPVATARVGLWTLLVAVTMLFVAFTASYLSRRNAPDWTPVPLPGLLWVNTAVLAASSAALEWARRAWRRGEGERLRRGLAVASGLGALFLLGQIAAWRQLIDAGVFMRSSPHSAFFYLLTAVHGLHLLGGLGGLGYALRRTDGPAVEGAALYWHFLAGLWVYVFLILFFI
ncbi:MAG: cytochrome c oxidase subunit 3 [Armatimonadetes bacterium]|nr:cytochrome c oxidase subunit 3 [Armatimonadota bacterium]